MGGERFGTGLADVQATLYDLITAPEGAAKRLAELDRPVGALDSIVKGTASLSAVERVDVYANMYFYRIRDVLRDEFAKTLSAVGDDAFHNLVTDYLVACRPSHPSLREGGARLPEFLARHPLAEERPWLAELARLERTHLELYDGSDAEILTLDHLRTLSADTLPALVLRAIPCHQLIANRFAASQAWKAMENGGAVQVVAEMPETLLVWRQGISVYHRPVDSSEAVLLTLIQEGARFDLVCERLLDSVPEDQAAAQALQLLGRWVADELIAAHV